MGGLNKPKKTAKILFLPFLVVCIPSLVGQVDPIKKETIQYSIIKKKTTLVNEDEK